MENVQKTVRLIDAAVKDISMLPATINMMKAYHKLQQSEGQASDPRTLEMAIETLPLLEEERARGFTFYFGLATIAIWGGLEAYIEDLLVKCLEMDEVFLACDQVRRLKVSIGDYSSMSPEERRYYVIATLDRDLAAPTKSGLGRFEALFEAFGLGGTIDPELRACILELASVRNVLVHRGGLADERLVVNCPWLNAIRQKPILVSGSMMHMYASAASLYATEVDRRALRHFGLVTESSDEFIASVRPLIKRTELRIKTSAEQSSPEVSP